MSTNEFTAKIQSLKHRAHNLGVTDSCDRTKIYNDNKVFVQWAAAVTTKYIRHLNLKNNMICECHQSKDVEVYLIPGIINPSEIFTKEMKDNAHYRILRHSMMIYLQDFLQYHHNVPSQIISEEKFFTCYYSTSERDLPEKLEKIGSQLDCIKCSSLRFSRN